MAEGVRAHIHESPEVMTVPLALLAFGSVFAGWLGAPEFLWGSLWDHWLGPLFGGREAVPHEDVGQEIVLMLLTLGIAALGFVLAYFSYCRGAGIAESLSSWIGGRPYQWLAHKYYIDELYEFLFVRPLTRWSGWLAQTFDLGIIDGIVNGVADSVQGNSLLWRHLQSGNVQHYLFAFLIGTLLVLGYYLYL